MIRALLRAAIYGCLFATNPVAAAAEAFPPDLFGYRQSPRTDVTVFPQWVQALERHLADDLRDGDCRERRLNTCHMREWQAFLREIRGLPRRQQLERVNRYANEKDYVLDLDNYGLLDYWAIPREFLFNGGDCEDYAITKLLSLRWLGHPTGALRIVVLQDTNLRIAHAVMAVGTGDDILILDNQAQEVLSHRRIVHYAPVYSVGETQWWMHLPES
jgi:predicted transglutaminase-like cysteine proteinase